MSELYLSLYDLVNIMAYAIATAIVLFIAIKIVREMLVPGKPIIVSKTVVV